MTTNDDYYSRRRLDVASLCLLLIGVASATLSLWLITDVGISILVIIPSIVSATIGATHITKRELTRR